MVYPELLIGNNGPTLDVEGQDKVESAGRIGDGEENDEVEEGVVLTEVDSERVLSDLLVFWGFANRGW